jgi:hypothetical protein
MWGSAEFRPSLFEGVLALEAVCLALVEKVRVLRGGVLFIRVEGESPFSTDLRDLGVRCLGTFWVEGM